MTPVSQMTFEVLEANPDLTLLKRQLLGQLESGSTALAAFKEFAVLETVFKGTHADPAIRDLERVHEVERGPGSGPGTRPPPSALRRAGRAVRAPTAG